MKLDPLHFRLSLANCGGSSRNPRRLQLLSVFKNNQAVGKNGITRPLYDKNIWKFNFIGNNGHFIFIVVSGDCSSVLIFLRIFFSHCLRQSLGIHEPHRSVYNLAIFIAEGGFEPQIWPFETQFTFNDSNRDYENLKCVQVYSVNLFSFEINMFYPHLIRECPIQCFICQNPIRNWAQTNISS